MKLVGQIEGDGEMFVGGASTGTARYHINFWQDEKRGSKTANGDIWCSDSALFQAVQSRDVMLVLSDGSRVEIAVHEYYGGQGRAKIAVNDPRPWFLDDFLFLVVDFVFFGCGGLFATTSTACSKRDHASE